MGIKSYAVATILVLSGPAFLVSFTDPNNQFFNVKSLLKPGFIVQGKYRFMTFLRIEILSFIKQCPLKFKSDNKR